MLDLQKPFEEFPRLKFMHHWELAFAEITALRAETFEH